MKKDGKIILIEDDPDDREIFKEVYDELGFENELVLLSDSTMVLDYLKNEPKPPFLIMSDINMPKMSGYQLRDDVLNDPDLTEKCVPYIFFTTAQSPDSIKEAYRKSVQGFFFKISDYQRFSRTLRLIIEYWKEAVTPY